LKFFDEAKKSFPFSYSEARLMRRTLGAVLCFELIEARRKIDDFLGPVLRTNSR
jgi:hypothetical protein